MTHHVLQLVLWAISVAAAVSTFAAPPNFVVLLFDDTGYADLGMTGGTLVPTPAIDSIASDGVTFTNGYVTASVCSPSRAGFLTGRYQQRYGHEFNLSGKTESAGLGLPTDAVTIAEIAKSRGYRTGPAQLLGSEDEHRVIWEGGTQCEGVSGSGLGVRIASCCCYHHLLPCCQQEH